MDDNDLDMVVHWLRVDPKRWIAGIVGGFFAGVVALVVAAIVAEVNGLHFLFPVKLFGGILLGAGATDTTSAIGAVIAGLLIFEAICGFFGFIFSHFVFSNASGALLSMGLVWGIFSWIFLWNLFLQSFHVIRFAGVTPGAALPVCLAYGLSMASIGFFDRMLR
jgi:hypothetical protein